VGRAQTIPSGLKADALLTAHKSWDKVTPSRSDPARRAQSFKEGRMSNRFDAISMHGHPAARLSGYRHLVS